MCLILLALNAHPLYKLVLAANRDEFYARPTATAGFWTDAPPILAGRDLAAGGTWLGITKTGRWAAVTNYRAPNALSGEKSRGDLTKNFLTGSESAANYLQRIAETKSSYSGFNLLVGNFGAGKSEISYYSNHGEKPVDLTGGIYGLSNALLDTNWHKVEKAQARFAKVLQTSEEIKPAHLFKILADRRVAPDEKLPQTGVGIERERILSPAFIATENYGTRLSTVLLIDQAGTVKFIEKTFVGEIGEACYQFSIAK